MAAGLLPAVALAVLAAQVSGMRMGPRGSAVRLPVNVSFEDYVVALDKDYHPDAPEHQHRRSLFADRVAEIVAHNKQAGIRWIAGINALTDRTEHELRRLRVSKGHRAPSGKKPAKGSSLLKARYQGLPGTLDWGHLAVAQDIPDQGACGSCWAVATASVLRGRYEVAYKTDRAFSVQQLVTCVKNDGSVTLDSEDKSPGLDLPQTTKNCGGTGGCEGATVELALQYAKEHGLHAADDFEYTASDGECPVPEASLARDAAHTETGLAANMLRWTKLPVNQAGPLMEALADGPVAVSVGAEGWEYYAGGIFDSCPEDTTIGHAVMAIGWGQEKGTKYWTIQNSWSPNWGEAGHIRLLRSDDDDEHCGNDPDPKVGTVCEPYPDSVKVCGMCGVLYDSVVPFFDKGPSFKGGEAVGKTAQGRKLSHRSEKAQGRKLSHRSEKSKKTKVSLRSDDARRLG
jgi:cathepsin L